MFNAILAHRMSSRLTTATQLAVAMLVGAACLVARTAKATVNFSPINCTSTPVLNYINYSSQDPQQLDPMNPLAPKLVPLTARWYAIRVGTLPAGAVLPTFSSSKKLIDGATVYRFRPDSHPVLSWIELCEKGGHQTGAAVFSERVDPGVTPAAVLEFDRPDCHFEPQPVVGIPDKGADASTKTLRFNCTAVGELGISLKPGVKGVGAGASTPVAGVTTRLKPISMESMGSVCKRLRIADP